MRGPRTLAEGGALPSVVGGLVDKPVIAVPTSDRTQEQAEGLGIPLATLNEQPRLDVAIDGADEVDPDFNLVKGGGGALLREKMVEICAKKFICIVDESKLCDGLGPGFFFFDLAQLVFCEAVIVETATQIRF